MRPESAKAMLYPYPPVLLSVKAIFKLNVLSLKVRIRIWIRKTMHCTDQCRQNVLAARKNFIFIKIYNILCCEGA
jgi:hypothetical protein